MRQAVEREPLVLAHGPRRDPAHRGLDRAAPATTSSRPRTRATTPLLTGEPEEPNDAAARELGVHLIAAGHHATERLGVQALAAHLADRFGLVWEYVEVDNPV